LAPNGTTWRHGFPGHGEGSRGENRQDKERQARRLARGKPVGTIGEIAGEGSGEQGRRQPARRRGQGRPGYGQGRQGNGATGMAGGTVIIQRQTHGRLAFRQGGNVAIGGMFRGCRRAIVGNLMLVLMMTRMGDASCGFVLAIARHRGPGELERQEHQQQEGKQAAQHGADVSRACRPAPYPVNDGHGGGIWLEAGWQVGTCEAWILIL